MVEMKVASVGALGDNGGHVVVLAEKAGRRMLVISVGPAEATAIALSLEGIQPRRPFTHDLAAAILGRVQAKLRRVVIHDLRDDVFIGLADLDTVNGVMEIDARASDAIALALRTDAPIMAARSVLEAAAITTEEDHWVY